GVDGPDPVWLFGNLLPRLRATVSLAEFDQNLYKNYKGHKLCGYYEFTKPVLMIGDPQLLKNVMIKDFDHFTDRRCSVFEMKEVYGMFTMDTIASIAFGVNILTELVITAQCVLFYIAGYDTTATTLSFVSYCLALHPKIQQKLLEEIDQVLQDCDNDITFEMIQNMTYLDMLIHFSNISFILVMLSKSKLTIPFKFNLPILTGLESFVKPTKIPVINSIIFYATQVFVHSIHRDPRHYEDPEKFDPERFSQSAKSGRSPMVYLPFGSGPRNCIGWRFALMEAKVALVHILKDFVFIPSKKTQVPIVLERSSGLLKAIDGVWVRIVTRTES
ncbi:Cytochrome P450 9e2, partial [Armadillidium nasatum]